MLGRFFDGKSALKFGLECEFKDLNLFGASSYLPPGSHHFKNNSPSSGKVKDGAPFWPRTTLTSRAMINPSCRDYPKVTHNPHS